jgi:hypothetical protein
MRIGQDKQMGLYRKFEVTRHDPNGKHKNCFYFVLDTDHDQFSVPALEAYVSTCEKEFPALAADLRGVVAVAKIKFAAQRARGEGQ